MLSFALEVDSTWLAELTGSVPEVTASARDDAEAIPSSPDVTCDSTLSTDVDDALGGDEASDGRVERRSEQLEATPRAESMLETSCDVRRASTPGATAVSSGKPGSLQEAGVREVAVIMLKCLRAAVVRTIRRKATPLCRA